MMIQSQDTHLRWNFDHALPKHLGPFALSWIRSKPRAWGPLITRSVVRGVAARDQRALG